MSEPERVGAILARWERERAEVEARVREACCTTTGLPGPSRVTLEQHIDRICDVVLRARRVNEQIAGVGDLAVTGSARASGEYDRANPEAARSSRASATNPRRRK